MPKQTVYVVVNKYGHATPTPVQRYDNRAAAEKHAAHLNKHFEYDEDEPIFAVWEETVLSEFNP